MDKKCPICGSANIVNADGELVCAMCGYVFPEAFEEDQPVVMRSEWLGSAPIKTERLSFAETRANNDEKYFLSTYGLKIAKVSDVLGFPQVVRDEATYLAKKLRKTTVCNGYSYDVVAGALVLIAAKIHGIVVKPQQVAKALGVKEKKMMKFYRKARFILNVNVPTRKASDYIFAYAKKLNIPESVAREATKLSTLIPQGVSPIVSAGASLYVVAHKAGLKIRQYEVAEVLDITEVALRRRAHYLETILAKENVRALNTKVVEQTVKL